MRYEAGLYPILIEAAPEFVLHPLAVDPERGWLLLPDAGSSVLPKGASVNALLVVLVRALPAYATIQRAMMSQVDAMLAVGVRDLRPAALPGVFEKMLAATRTYVDRHGTEADRQRWEETAALRPAVVDGCARLAASPVPVSLDHNDLQTANIRAGDLPRRLPLLRLGRQRRRASLRQYGRLSWGASRLLRSGDR